MIGDTEGCIGDRLVGEVTEREERVSDKDVDDLPSTIAESLMLDCEEGWELCCW